MEDHIELKKLSLNDGMDIYLMLKEQPELELGVRNPCFNKTYEQYKDWIKKSYEKAYINSSDINIVNQTMYWLYVNETPVGWGKLRHGLTDNLKIIGGHIGYVIMSKYRRKGYGEIILHKLTEKARCMGINNLLLTIHKENNFSMKVAISNNGEHTKTDGDINYVWINCS